MELFPSNISIKLGFDVIRSQLESVLLSRMGQDELLILQPSSDIVYLRRALLQVDELQQAIRFDDSLPLDHFLDVRDVLRRSTPEQAFVQSEELHAVRLVLETIRRLHDYFSTRRTKYPEMWSLVEKLEPQPEVERHIAGIVDDEGNLRDDASPELRRLRRQLMQTQHRLREVLNSELRRAVGEGHASEDQPTIRNGRMVIPIRVEAKRKIQGFIHDTSGTGQTVYIEPAACLELNNEVREIQLEEAREIERILRAVTTMLRAKQRQINHSLQVLGEFDLLQAKARISEKYGAAVPQLNEDGIIRLIDGRNPVLQLRFQRESVAGDGEPRVVVPLNLEIGDRFRTLVITGPNAGGKSVAMKTVGLFSLMLAHGLPVPADQRSTFSAFHNIFADIGDEQSMEEDLSTFSSHLANLRHMLRHADGSTLVLLDEAGTGTDPSEGGALAQALLEQFTARGARTIATTHHGTLKAFAHETESVENGSMQFDQGTLRPTYRFRAGIPGSSYAFEIADRLGLPPDLLGRSRELVGAQKTALEDLIAAFESRTQELARKLAEAETTQKALEREKRQYEERAQNLRSELATIRAKALVEAEAIVASANAEVEGAIREIREAEAEREATKAAREKLDRFRHSIAHRRKKVQRPVARKKSAVSEALSIGDQVLLDGGSTVAEVVGLKGNEAEIAFGSMRVRANLDRLSKVGGKRQQQVVVGKTSVGTDDRIAIRTGTSIDVRGRRVEEALQEVARLIDDAMAAGLSRVEVLHGKGTGALRLAIKEYLKGHQDVRDFSEGEWNQGGAGVTIVRL